ncbi:MAG: TolB family protein [Saprospiraceae bacterium]|nr:TolB family protein [Saprospiraceae bacterium]
MKTIHLFIFLFAQLMLTSQNSIGIFDNHEDIGNPIIKSVANYDVNTQTYTVEAAGANMWAKTDQFHFLWKKIKGDFIISATVQFIGKGVDPHRKMGIIARNELTTNSPYADACVHGDDLTSLQYRLTDTAVTSQVELSVFHPTHIELQRIGNKFTFSAAVFGENYKSVNKEMDLNESVFAGLFVCSHNANVVEKAIFSNVRIIIPAAKDFRPYRDYIGSHLEVMDVSTGQRKVLYSVPNSIQAPNWTTDGKTLIYNSEGKMYNFDLATNTPSLLKTGSVINNNNDHVISFDGKMLALSNHVGDKRISTLFTMPIGGSDNPTMITSPDSGHSYLHTWSPDGKKLIFTGQRNKQYDIWSIDIATKKEIQLTNTPTLDDSPEYTPDGKWIYFNSVRTGTMKLWRMKPNGSQQEQITFDEYNDWFPHFSPDGKWMIYLSYMPDINPAEHPWYKRVYIRIMPTSGGVARTIGYLYGGQGTINVPSWSPDSKKIAFVTNSKL